MSRHGCGERLQGIKGKRCKLLKGKRRIEGFWVCVSVADIADTVV